jgi:hypothetical protein
VDSQVGDGVGVGQVAETPREGGQGDDGGGFISDTGSGFRSAHG